MEYMPGDIKAKIANEGLSAIMFGMPGMAMHRGDLIAAARNNPNAEYLITRNDLENCTARMIAIGWRLGNEEVKQ